MDCKFKVGDVVRVIDKGFHYPCNYILFQKLYLKNPGKDRFFTEPDSLFKVISINNDCYKIYQIGIESLKTKNQYAFDSDGLIFAQPKPDKNFNAFKDYLINSEPTYKKSLGDVSQLNTNKQIVDLLEISWKESGFKAGFKLPTLRIKDTNSSLKFILNLKR